MQLESSTRRCSVCRIPKSSEEFYARYAKCKSCVRAAERARHHKNAARRHVTGRAWHARNREAILVEKRLDRVERPEIYKDRDRAKYVKHRARILAARAAYVAKNKAAVRAAKAKHWVRHSQNRRARQRSAFVESIDVRVLAKRDHDRCGLCLWRVAIEDRSIDHIVPLSFGGKHSYQNTQLAHLKCNIKKNAKIQGQLRLL